MSMTNLPPSEVALRPTPAQKKLLHALGTTLSQYAKSAKSLLTGKYQHLREIAPAHLVNPGNILVGLCSDGVVVRFEQKTNDSRVIAALLEGDLTTGVLLLSQNAIFCHPKDRVDTPPPDSLGIDLKLFITDPATNLQTPILSNKIWFDAPLDPPVELPRPPQKPFCALSVRSYLDLQFSGVLAPTDKNSSTVGEHFLTRSRMKLGVGWECIEVFPNVQIKNWKPEYARVWAENDILASALMHSLNEAQYQTLDPRAESRRHFARLLAEFKALLDTSPAEEVLQQFLKSHPGLLCPAHTRMWPKLSIGAHTTDFVFREANDDYLLVEIERSTHKLFNRDGHTASALNHAIGQISDWKRYIEDNLSTVQRELGLDGVSANPRGLIIIGRANTVSDQNRRKLVQMQNEHPKLKILTYDDVYDNAKSVVENLLGPLLDIGGQTYFLGKAPLPASAPGVGHEH
jgi:hypothetical protein